MLINVHGIGWIFQNKNNRNNDRCKIEARESVSAKCDLKGNLPNDKCQEAHKDIYSQLRDKFCMLYVLTICHQDQINICGEIGRINFIVFFIILNEKISGLLKVDK